MKTLQSMCTTSPVDADEQLPNVERRVPIVEGSADPELTPPFPNRTLTHA
jgi:hypothetical protein